MKVGSIVTPKKGVQFDPRTILLLTIVYGLKHIPVHGETFVVEQMADYYCEHCKEQHYRMAIDGVGCRMIAWDTEDFEELQPPVEVKVENLMEEPALV